MARLKCVTFDVTNTLIQVSGGVGFQYSKLINEKFNLKLDPELVNQDFRRYFKKQNQLYPGFGFSQGLSSKDWWSTVVKGIILDNLKHQKSKVESTRLDEMFNYLFDEFTKAKCWRTFDHAHELLRTLKPTYKLGVISNFDQRLPAILANLELINYFDFIVTPHAANGFAKPAVQIFRRAFELARVQSPSDLLHIGDDAELDHKAALNAGHRALVIAHQPTPNNSQHLRHLAPLIHKQFTLKY